MKLEVGAGITSGTTEASSPPPMEPVSASAKFNPAINVSPSAPHLVLKSAVLRNAPEVAFVNAWSRVLVVSALK
ncbi:hypothetical protein D3C73_1359330 [compost metagenome]